MAGVYVYGVVAAEGPRVALPPGVGGSRPLLHRRSGDGLAAIVSPIRDAAPHATKRDLRAHEEVLRAALDVRDPVLPLRFGTVYRDSAELEEQLLAPAAVELQRLLAELRGCVELELRALYPDEDELLREIVEAEPRLAQLRERMRRGGYGDRIALGEAVHAAYERRRAADEELLLNRLAPL